MHVKTDPSLYMDFFIHGLDSALMATASKDPRGTGGRVPLRDGARDGVIQFLFLLPRKAVFRTAVLQFALCLSFALAC